MLTIMIMMIRLAGRRPGSHAVLRQLLLGQRSTSAMNVFALSSAWASAQLLAPTRRISGKDLVATKKPAKEEEDGFESLFMIGSLLDAAREVRASDVDDLLVHLSTCPNMVRDAIEPKTGFGPLHYAANAGSSRIVTSLLRAGANPVASDKYGKTPLHLAAKRGHSDVVELLLACDASKPWALPAGPPSPTRVELTDIGGGGGGSVKTDRTVATETPLQLAARYAHVDVINILLAAGFLVDERNALAETALHVAATHGHAGVCSAGWGVRACALNASLNPERRTFARCVRSFARRRL